jgi:hypothetical protein
VFSLSANAPIAVLKTPVEFVVRALDPTAVLSLAEVLLERAKYPTAVLPLPPVVLLERAFSPTAVTDPAVFTSSASKPSAVSAVVVLHVHVAAAMPALDSTMSRTAANNNPIGPPAFNPVLRVISIAPPYFSLR